MKLPSFEGLVVNSLEYKRVANRRFYLRHRELEMNRAKNWRLNNPEKYRAWARKNKKKRQAANRLHEYGLTNERFEAMMKSQRGRCAICRQKLKRPDVDHNHKTGKVRGLLCRSCNSFLGLAQESKRILTNAVQYLGEHNGRR